MRRFALQTPQGVQPDLGIQLRYKVPGDFQFKIGKAQ